MLKVLKEELILSGDDDAGDEDKKTKDIKKDDGIETVDNGEIGIEQKGDEEEKDTTQKKMKNFCDEMEDRIKTLFIRTSRSYGFINGGQISSVFIDSVRQKLEVTSKKLVMHEKM